MMSWFRSSVFYLYRKKELWKSWFCLRGTDSFSRDLDKLIYFGKKNVSLSPAEIKNHDFQLWLFHLIWIYNTEIIRWNNFGFTENIFSEHYGRTTAASQYFLQLAGYMGIPVISWNADNSGFERRVSTVQWIERISHFASLNIFHCDQSLKSQLRVQLAPSIEHQVSAMVAIMVR